MSTKERKPLLSDDDIDNRSRVDYANGGIGPYWRPRIVRDHYEAARAKDAELIQQLVDAVYGKRDICEEADARYIALAAAKAAGFTPNKE